MGKAAFCYTLFLGARPVEVEFVDLGQVFHHNVVNGKREKGRCLDFSCLVILIEAVELGNQLFMDPGMGLQFWITSFGQDFYLGLKMDDDMLEHELKLVLYQ